MDSTFNFLNLTTTPNATRREDQIPLAESTTIASNSQDVFRG